MKIIINLGNYNSAIAVLRRMKENEYSSIDIKIINSHIMLLNEIVGKRLFKNDALYIDSKTLWEIMQPVGGRGRHHYHSLNPEDIMFVLTNLKYSKTIIPSYDNRILIIALPSFTENKTYAVIIDPNGNTKNKIKNRVIRIITIYPYNKK